MTRNKNVELDKWQRMVSDAYEGGEYAYIRTRSEVNHVCDGLFQFLMTEISEAEGVEDIEEAVRRMGVVMREVIEVLNYMNRNSEGEVQS